MGAYGKRAFIIIGNQRHDEVPTIISFSLVCCDRARAPVFWVSIKKDELARNRLITYVVEAHVELCKKLSHECLI